RSDNKVGKKEKQPEASRRVGGGGELTAIHVNRVAERLKCVEADTHREDDLEGQRRRMQPEQSAEARERITEEVEILEQRQDAQVRDQGQDQPRSSRAFALLFLQGEADHEIDPR